MECPYCEEELICTDYYGLGNPLRDGFEKQGDIFKCDNKNCEMYQESFYTDSRDELQEGYPC